MSVASSTLRSTAEGTMHNSCGGSLLSELNEIIVAEWRQTHSPDLVSMLEKYPQLLHNKSLLLNLALDEFKAQQLASAHIDLSQHCQRSNKFGSTIEQSVFRQLEVQRYIEAHPELIELFRTPIWPTDGDTIAGFTFITELGRGGIARVYL